MQADSATSLNSHPKINKYLVYSGIISNLVILVFFFLGSFSLSLLAFFIGNVSYVLLGGKKYLIEKGFPAKTHDILTGTLMFIGSAILIYDLVVNILPGFK